MHLTKKPTLLGVARHRRKNLLGTKCRDPNCGLRALLEKSISQLRSHGPERHAGSWKWWRTAIFYWVSGWLFNLFRGCGKHGGGWLRFGWIVQNPHCFSCCPVLWALSHNLPPLVVVVRAPLLQFEVPQIYAVWVARGWHIVKHPNPMGCNKLLDRWSYTKLLRQWPQDLTNSAALLFDAVLECGIHPYCIPIPKALRCYTLSLGKAQTMSCIWA